MDSRAALPVIVIVLILAAAGPYADALPPGGSDTGGVESQALTVLAALEAGRTELADAISSAEVHLEGDIVCGPQLPPGCIARPRDASILLLSYSRLHEATGRTEHLAAAKALLYALESRNLTCPTSGLPLRMLAMRALHQTSMEVRHATLCSDEWEVYVPVSAEDGAWAVLAALRRSETTGEPTERAIDLARAGAGTCVPPWSECSSPRDAGLWLIALASAAGSTQDLTITAALANLTTIAESACGEECVPADRFVLIMGLAHAGHVLDRPEVRERALDRLDDVPGCDGGECNDTVDQAWGALAEAAVLMPAPYPSFLGFRAEGLGLVQVTPEPTRAPPTPTPPPSAFPSVEPVGAVLIGFGVVMLLGAIVLWLQSRGAWMDDEDDDEYDEEEEDRRRHIRKKRAKEARERSEPKKARPPTPKGGAGPPVPDVDERKVLHRDPEARREEFAKAVEYICRRLEDGYDHDIIMASLKGTGYSSDVVRDAVAFSLNEYEEGRSSRGETRDDVRADLLGRGFPVQVVERVLEQTTEDYVVHLLHRGYTQNELGHALAQAGYDQVDIEMSFSTAVKRFRADLIGRGVEPGSVDEKLRRQGFG